MAVNISNTGAYLIARTLRELGVTVLFGIVGIPVTEIAEHAIDLGIRYIGCRNEQAASYAASVWGYLTGKPGVCLVVGGPGVIHAMAGVANAQENCWPLLLLGGSIETSIVTKGGFQEMDAVSLLSPHIKFAVRPPAAEDIPQIIVNAYRHCWYGRAGSSFVDLPADFITAELKKPIQADRTMPMVMPPPSHSADPAQLFKVAQVIKSAKAPLIVIGKGAAYARAEKVVREFVGRTRIPFLPSPMGKGMVPDSHPQNASSMRSMAMRLADVVLIFGARLNWMFAYGLPPKWSSNVRFVQFDICPEEIGRNHPTAELGVLGDLNIALPQLLAGLTGWQFDHSGSPYIRQLATAKRYNEDKALSVSSQLTNPLSYTYAYKVIKQTLDSLSPPTDGGVVLIAEGSKTMDISRSSFALEHPRLRLDAGTYATMGLGLGYAIAAYEAYNGTAGEAHSGSSRRKKIVALEGDSAFGFSGMEVETMARYGMDILIFIMNNAGIFQGDTNNAQEWLEMQKTTLNHTVGAGGLRSWSLGWQIRYEKLAEACGGKGYFVQTPEELAKATRDGFAASVPVIVNVVIDSGRPERVESASHRSPNESKL